MGSAIVAAYGPWEYATCMTEEKAAWIGLSAFPGIGPVRCKHLYDYFGSARAIWDASGSTLRDTGLGEKLVASFESFRKIFDAKEYQKKLFELHVSTLTIHDPQYPKLLSAISDAPFLLYIKGKRTEHPVNLNRTVAVVGTRNVTPYGREVTKRLVTELVSYGCTIVSGLAYGVDTIAHQAALDAGGKTIAVLGCGIDIIAPSSNARLYQDIANGGGAIVSEMPLGMRPNKGLFPARNRIISGLSLGVVVTEGDDDSGALITARNAVEQGREVFAVPGPITSRYSRGPAKLLKNGAKLVESVDDILEELSIERKTTVYKESLPIGRTLGEQKILDILIAGHTHIDDLVHGSGLTIASVNSTITILEMRGVIQNYGDKIYGLAKGFL